MFASFSRSYVHSTCAVVGLQASVGKAEGRSTVVSRVGCGEGANYEGVVFLALFVLAVVRMCTQLYMLFPIPLLVGNIQSNS